MKSTSCLHPKSPLRKRGVERAEYNLRTIFLIGNSTRILHNKKLEYQWQKYKEGYFQEIPVRDQFF